MYTKYANIRDSKNLTDYQVAKISGVSTATLSEWKRGNYTPKYDKLKAIAEALETPVTEFLE